MRIWLLVLALAVAVAGVVLFVLAREQPTQVTVAPHDAAAAVAVVRDAAIPTVHVVDAAVIDAPAGPPPELATLRSSGTANEVWIPQAKNLLRGFDPHAEVECYVAGCAAALHFELDNAYQDALDVIKADETWTGGKKFLPPVRGADGTITAVLILYRPD